MIKQNNVSSLFDETKFFEKLNNSKQIEDENENWLTTKQAATYLGITPNALRILVHKGKVDAFKLGSHLRFTHSALRELLLKKEY